MAAKGKQSAKKQSKKKLAVQAREEEKRTTRRSANALERKKQKSAEAKRKRQAHLKHATSGSKDKRTSRRAPARSHGAKSVTKKARPIAATKHQGQRKNVKKGKPTAKRDGKKSRPSAIAIADVNEPTLSVVGANAKVLSHIDKRGATRMVDVSDKKVTQREATAEAYVVMEPSTLTLIQAGGLPKGDVLAVARVAGIMAAKNTSNLIPMCHPLQITGVTVDIAPAFDDHLRITATVKVRGKTGVEMEALTAATVASLTVYDMCKAVDKGMRIEGIRLLEKLGGRSGHWVAETS